MTRCAPGSTRLESGSEMVALNDPLRTWINDDLVKLGKEDFFHQNFRKTLEPVYGDTIKPDQLVIEGGRK